MRRIQVLPSGLVPLQAILGWRPMKGRLFCLNLCRKLNEYIN